jgi:hypothetical protein
MERTLGSQTTSGVSKGSYQTWLERLLVFCFFFFVTLAATGDTHE